MWADGSWSSFSFRVICGTSLRFSKATKLSIRFAWSSFVYQRTSRGMRSRLVIHRWIDRRIKCPTKGSTWLSSETFSCKNWFEWKSDDKPAHISIKHSLKATMRSQAFALKKDIFCGFLQNYALFFLLVKFTFNLIWLASLIPNFRNVVPITQPPSKISNYSPYNIIQSLLIEHRSSERFYF